jgi:hypothetical protein
VELKDLREGLRVRVAFPKHGVLVCEILILDPQQAAPVLVKAVQRTDSSASRLTDGQARWCRPEELEPVDPIG